MADSELSSNEPNDICRDCLFWKKFGKDCYVYWHRKKFCTMKVSDDDMFEETKNIFKIDNKQA